MRRITRGALIGFLFALTVGVWPAGASVSNVKVTAPTQDQVLAGQYSSDGTPSGFKVNLRGSATASCPGFSNIRFTVTSPWFSNAYNVGSTSTKNWSGGPSTPWDTQDLKNGVYDVRIDVTENNGTLCNPQSGSAHVTAKLANPPTTPAWIGSPSAASNGSAEVTFSWKKNGEPDVVEYHITRTGPGEDTVIVVGASNPGTGCSLSGTTYSCTDPPSNFPAGYGGTYSYSIRAFRSRPDYNSSESPKTNCVANDKPCVDSSSSDVKQVTLTEPTPTPTPTPTDTPSGTPTPGGPPTVGIGTPGTGGGSGGSSGGGTSVLGFGSGGGSGVNPFYTGTYDPRLPYTPKSLIVGNGTSTPDGKQVEAGAVSDPPNYRTVMLPLAGGLLAFLSAAHVRRLLIHF